MNTLFKDKSENAIFNNANAEFCGEYECDTCPIAKELGFEPSGADCITWVENNPRKAAELMNYTLVQEESQEKFDRVQKHLEIVTSLNNLYASKNSDYGNSFGETYQKLGIISALTRISDKYNRLVSLATKPEEERKVKDESIQDTLLDMANYCIMTIIEMEAEKENA